MFLRLGDEGVPPLSSADTIALYAVYWYRDCIAYAAVQDNVCSSHITLEAPVMLHYLKAPFNLHHAKWGR